MPSLWHETFGMVLIEAFAVGTPVVASRLGGMAEIVDDGRTGLHVVPGSAKDLKVKVQYLIDHPDVALEMGNNARQEYLKKYTPEINFEMLSNIYRRAIDSQKQR